MQSRFFPFYILFTPHFHVESLMQTSSFLSTSIEIAAYWNNRLERIRILGEGNSAVSFLMKDKETNRLLVLKQYKHSVLGQDVARLLRETEYLQQLHHECIPSYIAHYVTEIQGRPLLHVVVEYIEGVELRQAIKQRRLNERETWSIIDKLLSILAYLQQLQPPIIHRDIKPSNIIVNFSVNTDDVEDDEEMSLALIDFGSAVDWIHRTFGATMNVGTLGYMSPEQIHGQPELASDVYSVGVIAWELLTRRQAVDALEGFGFRWKPAMRNFSTEIQQWMTKMLAENPKERFASAKEALLTLRRFRNISAPTLVEHILEHSDAPWQQQATWYWFSLCEQSSECTVDAMALQWFTQFSSELEDGGMPAMMNMVRAVLLPNRQFSTEEYLRELVYHSPNGRRLLDELANIRLDLVDLKQQFANCSPFRFLKYSGLQERIYEYEQYVLHIQSRLSDSCQAWARFVNIVPEKILPVLEKPYSNPTVLPFEFWYLEDDDGVSKPVCWEMVKVPQHNFYPSYSISSTLVTQEMYEAVMGKNPSVAVNSLHPVESLSWYDVVEFCNTLSIMFELDPVYNVQFTDSKQKTVLVSPTANGFRIPNFAIWKRSARGDEGYRFAGSDDLNAVAWYGGQVNTHQPVGLKKPNAWGLYDMMGNVAEWCEDVNSEGKALIVGGSYRDDIEYLAMGFHSYEAKSFSSKDLGFRLLRFL